MTLRLQRVIVGKDHVITGQSGVPTIIVPFTCFFGEFAMEVSLKTNGNS